MLRAPDFTIVGVVTVVRIRLDSGSRTALESSTHDGIALAVSTTQRLQEEFREQEVNMTRE